MTESDNRVCVGCGESESVARLEICTMCHRSFCPVCAFHAGMGRRFCTPECGRSYYFAGDPDDFENDPDADD